MGISFFHDGVHEFVGDRYNSLFSRWALCGMLYFSSLVDWFGESCIMNFKDFLIWQSWECFFDFEDIDTRVGGLGIGHGERQRVFTLEHAYFLVLL